MFVTGLLLWAPLSHAAPRGPEEETVQLLLHSNHGATELASKRVRAAMEAVRRDPRPYLPALRVHITLERIEAATDAEQLRAIKNAAWLLISLGGEQEREALKEQLRALQSRRDELSAQPLGPGAGPLSLEQRQQPSFRARVTQVNRLIAVEVALVRGFAASGDVRLKDALLSRLEQEELGLQEVYIDYFAATARGDSVVQARLRKMLEAPPSPATEQHLRRFFSAPSP
jgi:hypothetical protein